MHHHLFTLRQHVDVTKFEFEDGIIRAAAPSLLSEESSIHNLLIDVSTERTLNNDSEPPDWEGSLLISSAAPEDASPGGVAELIVDVGSIVDHKPVMLIEFSDLESTWVGVATPGPKVSFVLRQAAGIDASSFNAWLRDTMTDVTMKVPGVGSRSLGPLDDAAAGDNSVLSFWFSNEGELDRAVADNVFAPIFDNPLVESDSVRTWSTVEHRLAPTPGAWDMPTGPLMANREIDSDS